MTTFVPAGFHSLSKQNRDGHRHGRLLGALLDSASRSTKNRCCPQDPATGRSLARRRLFTAHPSVLPGLSTAFCPGCSAVAARFSPDRKSTRLNSSHGYISYAVFCLKKNKR